MRMFDPKTEKTFYRKRRHRIDEIRTPHELTFSCFRGYKFLAKDRTRLWFIEELDAARHRWQIDLWAWVIMPEHVHVLVAPRELGLDIGKFQGEIKEQVARKAIKWLSENAPSWISKITVKEGNRNRRRFWQPGGGYDRNVDQERTLSSMIDYIHLNPVRRGLVARPEDWEWSSARWYKGQTENAHLEMDRTLPTIVR